MDPKKAARMMRDPMAARKLQQIRKQRVVEKEQEVKSYVPLEKVELDIKGAHAKTYTSDQNYQAYKLFSIMDTNSGGSITLREMKRIFLGHSFTTLTAKFDHPDSGIVWTIDTDDCVIIERCEEYSPASRNPFLIRGLRVVRINTLEVKLRDKSSMKLVYNYLLQLHDEPVEIEFIEPPIIISQFSCMIDIEVASSVYSVVLPIGGHYNLKELQKGVTNSLIAVHRSFRYLTFHVDEESRQVSFKSEKFPFRILFKSGPNASRSCRYAFGFSSEDTDDVMDHTGQKMLIKLDLDIETVKLEKLIDELFGMFDIDASGELEFEEFRNLFCQFMYTEESQAFLKRYAMYRFRDTIKEEAFWAKEKADAERKKRVLNNRQKNLSLKKAQFANFMASSRMDEDGNRRKVYVTKREDGIMKLSEKKRHRRKMKADALFNQPFFPYEGTLVGNSDSGSMFEDALLSDRDIVQNILDRIVDTLRLRELDEKDERRRKKKAKLMSQFSPNRSPLDDDADSTVDGTVPNAPSSAQILEMKDDQAVRRKKLAENRKAILQKIFEANKVLNDEEKRSQKKVEEAEKKLHMTEVFQALAKGIKSAIDVRPSSVEGMQNINVNVVAVVASPALKLNPRVFTGADIQLSDVDLVPVPATKMHPGVTGYFLVREAKIDNYTIRESKIKNTNYDCTTQHPAFFTADYERKSNRHSDVALGVVRNIIKDKEAGDQYRMEKGIAYEGNRIPPEDIIPPRAGAVTRVKFDPIQPEIKTNVLARATVREVVLTDLPRVHVLEPNSPFVRLECGQFMSTSEINAFSGDEATWYDLDWVFRMSKGQVIKIIVSSGSVLKNTVIGSVDITAEDFAKLPVSKYGDMSFKVSLKTEGGAMAGQLNMNFFVELGGEFDWYAWRYHRNRKDAIKLRKFRRRLLEKKNAALTDYIKYPLKIDLFAIRVFDLSSMHTFVKNSPQVLVDCGAFSKRTDVKEQVGDSAEYLDINWSMDFFSERSNLIFVVTSNNTTIGRFAINASVLAELPRKRDGRFTLTGNLVNPQGITGKIEVEGKLYTTPINNITNMESFELSSVETFSTFGTSNSNALAMYFPGRITILGAAVMDLPSVHFMHPNSPLLEISSGSYFKSTNAVQDGGEGGEWRDLDLQIPMTDRMHIRITVMSKELKIGYVVFEAIELALARRSAVSAEFVELVRPLVDGSSEVGTIKVVFTINKESEGALYTFFPEETRSWMEVNNSLSAPLEEITGYGSVAFSVDSTANKTFEAKPNKFLYMPAHPYRPRPTKLPFRLTINSLVIVDLPSVHMLSKNSPHINASCGLWANVTPPVAGGGSQGSWSGLNWAFFVHAGAILRLTTWSHNTMISTVYITAEELLEAFTNDSSGVTEIFRNSLVDGDVKGKLKITCKKESIDPGDAVDEFSYTLGEVRLEPPLLVTVYTIAVMDLRQVHPFSRNHPSLRGTCGKWKDSTLALRTNGREAKWEDVMWGVAMRESAEFKVAVMSDTIVIGYCIFRTAALIAKPIDKFGLTEIEGDLIDGNRIDPTGKIRMVCRLEPHPDNYDDDDSSESEDDFKYEYDGQTTLLGVPKVFIPKVTRITIFEVLVTGLEVKGSIPSFLLRPLFMIECDKFSRKTKNRFIENNSVCWKGPEWLGQIEDWSFVMRRTTTIKMSIGSSSASLGSSTIGIRDVYKPEKDEEGFVFLKRSLMLDGYYVGDISVKVKLETVDDGDDELDEALFFYDPLSIPYNPEAHLSVPFMMGISSITLIDLLPLHTVARNAPSVTMKVGDVKRKTDAWELADSSANWQSVNWTFLLMNSDSDLQIIISSRRKFGGIFTINALDILSIPRSSTGLTVIAGQLKASNGSSIGKFSITTKLAHYETPDEKESRRLAEAEARRPPLLIAYISIFSVQCEAMVQIYGLFKNCPRVQMKVGSYEYSTETLWGAGEEASWTDLNWNHVPVYEKALICFSVISGNEIIGGISLRSELVYQLEQDEYGFTTLIGDLTDGLVCKGVITIGAKIDFVDPISLADSQSLSSTILTESMTSKNGNNVPAAAAASNNDSSANNPTTVVSELVMPPPLSLSTATPLMTKAFIHDLYLYDLKKIHSFGKNSPQVRFECGNWKNQTSMKSAAGDNATWNNLALPFVMKKMTFVKITVHSKNINIGWVSISTRELLEVPRDENGMVSLTRTIENDADVTGKIRLVMKIETIGELPAGPGTDIGASPANVAEESSVQSRLSSSQASIFTSKTIATPLNIELPFTAEVFKIIVVDLAPLHTFTPNSPFVQINFGETKKKTGAIHKAGSSAEWPSLDWAFHVFDEKAMFMVSVYSSSVLAGKLSLTVSQFIGTPPEKDGTTIISGLIKKDGGIRAKISVYCTVRPYVSAETRKALDLQERSLHTPRLLGNMTIILIIASEISRMVPEMTITISCGLNWKKTTDKTEMKVGIGAWGNLDWSDIPLKELTYFTASAYHGNAFVGSMEVEAEDLATLPAEGDGSVTLSGNLVGKDGLFKGKISIGCKISFGHEFNYLVGESSSFLASQPIIHDNNLSNAENGIENANSNIISGPMTSSYLNRSNVDSLPTMSAVVVRDIFANDLKAAHGNGSRNVPRVLIECGSHKFKTHAAPSCDVDAESGSSAHWKDMKCNFSMKQRGSVRLSVLSGATLIGTVTLSTREMWDAKKATNETHSAPRKLEIYRLQRSLRGSTSARKIGNEDSSGVLEIAFTILDLEDADKDDQSSFVDTYSPEEAINTTDVHNLQGRSVLSAITNPSLLNLDDVDTSFNGSRPNTSRGLDPTSARSQLSDYIYEDEGLTGRSWVSHSSDSSRSDESDRSSSDSARSGISDESASTHTSRSGTDEDYSVDNTPRSGRSESSHQGDGYDDDGEGVEDDRFDEQKLRWLQASRNYGGSSAVDPKVPILKSSSADRTIVIDDGEDDNHESSISKKVYVFDLTDVHWFKADEDPKNLGRIIAMDLIEDLLQEAMREVLPEAIPETKEALQKRVPTLGGVIRPAPYFFLGVCDGSDLIRDFSYYTARRYVQVAGSAALGALLHFPFGKSMVSEPSWIRRKGLLIAKRPMDYNALVNEISSSVDIGKGYQMFNSIYGPVPMRGRFLFIDVVGLDFSCIDRRVLPKRPYLTACKPYGNWSAETKLAWVSDRNLAKKEMKIDYYNLPEVEQWAPCLSRLGQHVVFDFHDAGSGLIFAKFSTSYEYLVSRVRDEDGCVAMYAKFDIAQEYGGGSASAVIRYHVDLSCNVWLRPLKPAAFWDRPRIHHWHLYPLTPIATGIVRSHYGDVAKDYDKQKIVHPVFFGFNVRWRGHQQDESRFVHPMFQGFTYAKKKLDRFESDRLEEAMSRIKDPNPYRYDPEAAVKKRCLTCGGGSPGCPRCFMLPITKRAGTTKLKTFAFEPEKEMKRLREEKDREIARAAVIAKFDIRRRNIIADGRFELVNQVEQEFEDALEALKPKRSLYEIEKEMYGADDDDDPDAYDASLTIHTNLTTFDALISYRKRFMNYFTIYIKVLPAGYVRKFVMHSENTTFQLYNCFDSHSDVSTSTSNKIVLPCESGLFPIDCNIIPPDEFSIGDNTGKDPLSRYGMKLRGSIVVLFYFRNFTLERAPIMLGNFITSNSNFRLKIPPASFTTNDVVKKLHRDNLQLKLKELVIRQFNIQQLEEKENNEKRNYEFRMSGQLEKEKALREKQKRKEEVERETKEAQRRIESELRHFPEGPEREKMRKILEERESHKRGHVSEEERLLAEKKEKQFKLRAAKLLAKRRALEEDILFDEAAFNVQFNESNGPAVPVEGGGGHDDEFRNDDDTEEGEWDDDDYDDDDYDDGDYDDDDDDDNDDFDDYDGEEGDDGDLSVYDDEDDSEASGSHYGDEETSEGVPSPGREMPAADLEQDHDARAFHSAPGSARREGSGLAPETDQDYLYTGRSRSTNGSVASFHLGSSRPASGVADFIYTDRSISDAGSVSSSRRPPSSDIEYQSSGRSRSDAGSVSPSKRPLSGDTDYLYTGRSRSDSGSSRSSHSGSRRSVSGDTDYWDDSSSQASSRSSYSYSSGDTSSQGTPRDFSLETGGFGDDYEYASYQRDDISAISSARSQDSSFSRSSRSSRSTIRSFEEPLTQRSSSTVRSYESVQDEMRQRQRAELVQLVADATLKDSVGVLATSKPTGALKQLKLTPRTLAEVSTASATRESLSEPSLRDNEASLGSITSATDLVPSLPVAQLQLNENTSLITKNKHRTFSQRAAAKSVIGLNEVKESSSPIDTDRTGSGRSYRSSDSDKSYGSSYLTSTGRRSDMTMSNTNNSDVWSEYTHTQRSDFSDTLTSSSYSYDSRASSGRTYSSYSRSSAGSRSNYSDLSDTPRSELPGGADDEYERLPTDRSDFTTDSSKRKATGAAYKVNGKSLSDRITSTGSIQASIVSSGGNSIGSRAAKFQSQNSSRKAAEFDSDEDSKTKLPSILKEKKENT